MISFKMFSIQVGWNVKMIESLHMVQNAKNYQTFKYGRASSEIAHES